MKFLLFLLLMVTIFALNGYYRKIADLEGKQIFKRNAIKIKKTDKLRVFAEYYKALVDILLYSFRKKAWTF